MIMMMNKPSKEVLNVFGKMLYSLAMVDGMVQESELKTLRKIVSKNKWAKEIEFSFTEAMELKMNPRISFLKNMRVFSGRDMAEHFPFFLELMEKVAQAHEGMNAQEISMIQEFKNYKSKMLNEQQSIDHAYERHEAALQIPLV